MNLRPLLAALALFAGHAMAEDLRLYRDSDTVDPREVARILDTTVRPPIKFRGLKLLDEQSGSDAPIAHASAAGAPPPSAPEAPRPSALALPVQFSFDSADILPAARTQLDALAEGIRLLPATQSVLIEGHTDATGTEQYNEQLSQRRAQSVKRYLVAMHHIDAARLHVAGMGKHAPLPGRDPHAPENRRVQFRGE
jgi:outer membrane protein OmpA-like peptidoglycan-associated protein